jgi:hypothetical protein
MEDYGLAPMSPDRPRLSFPDSLLDDTIPAPYKLERIFNLQNVNALPERQEIRFGKQLTLIYGENGAGKTGYTRPLASAGFARGERQVLPDATRPDKRKDPQADIEISLGGVKQVVRWTSGKRRPELSGFYVFDSDSVVAHLTRSNALSFSPRGLLLLTRLAEVTDLVRERIRTAIDEYDKAQDFHLLFDGESQVRQIVLSLGPMTNLQSLESLAKLSEDEKSLLVGLERKIAELRLLDIPKQIAKRRQEIDDIENLKKALIASRSALSDSAKAEIATLIERVNRAGVEVEKSGVNQFTSDAFIHVGTTEWIEFLASAKVLADAEIGYGRMYPAPGAPCLLCRQPLSADAVVLLERLWEFLRSDAQAGLESAQCACVDRVQELELIKLNYFNDDSNARRLIQGELEIIIPAIEAQIESCSARREAFVEALRSYATCSAPPLIDVDLTDLERLAEIRRRDVQELTTSDVGQRLRAAENSYRELKHRQTLALKLPDIKRYVQGKKWAAQARQYLGSTRAITTKYSELFKELVTDKYVSLFEEMLRRFKKNIRVAIETRGSKGETVRQLVLSSDTFMRPFPVSQVLSDGEKRAVAISDFLAEVALDQNCCGIIFDDPVTSLDDRWNDAIAKCLAEQSKLKQVIVFTHDLAFLYRIKNHAEGLTVEVTSHWIKDEDGHPGFVYQDNSPVCEKDYKSAKMAQELYTKAKTLPPEEQQATLRQAFGALRTSYEALIIFDLFNGVVQRFEERISFGSLAQVRIDQAQVEAIIKRMETLSRHIDAHLHSDRFAPVKPTLDDLLQELNAFEAIRKKQKELKQSN